jgi:hypothetical protein
VANLLEEAIGRTLTAYSHGTLPWKFEADFEARTLMWLIIRNSEGVYEMARKDLVLLPPALAACRSAFEIAVRALWLLEPKDPFDREARWLAQLTTEESHHERIAKKVGDWGLDGSGHLTHAKMVREFRLSVASVMPAGYDPIQQVPNLEMMLKSLKMRHLYLHYMVLSQFAHGTHVAGGLYRQGYGTRKRGGEFINSADWKYPLQICFSAVTSVGSKLAERVGSDARPFLTDAFRYKFEVALKRLKAEKAEMSYWKRPTPPVAT